MNVDDDCMKWQMLMKNERQPVWQFMDFSFQPQ